MVVYTRIHLVIVSIHTPTQGVTTSIMYPAQASQFQSTHPRRVWPFCTFAMCSEYVSIHTPTQGVTAATIFCSEFNKFQSTHPRRVWLIYHFLHFRTECFNPHTHAGCDDVTVYFSVSAKVSIHTPTQGVTQSITSTKLIKIVSIHTPTQGVTKICMPIRNINLFQSTHPRRVWLLKMTEEHFHQMFQSTHPRRVWQHLFYTMFQLWCFNPHTHAGCDYWLNAELSAWRVFQSTHPRRVWQRSNIYLCGSVCFNPHTHAGCDYDIKFSYTSKKCFNPHTHAGCDGVCIYHGRFLYMFQSTHPRRVWQNWLAKYEENNPVSIHTPTQGVTESKNFNFRNRGVSIHTPTQGVTESKTAMLEYIKFQSTHPRRVWLITTIQIWIWTGFNPHTHAGCDRCKKAFAQ